MDRKRPNNSDSRHYYDWLDLAGEDILAARLLIKDDNCYNSAAFHCHQAVEKSLKSYILLKAGRLVEGHNLPWLCRQAQRYHKSFHQWLDEAVALNRCYIETRYPADIPLNLDYNQTNSYYKMAHDIYIFITEEMDTAVKKGGIHHTQK